MAIELEEKSVVKESKQVLQSGAPQMVTKQEKKKPDPAKLKELEDLKQQL